MKKQQYILLSAILLLLGACSQKEEAVYGKGTSYVQRTNQTLSEYASTLEGTPQWLLTLYAGENQSYGGYNFLVSFARGKVTAASEVLPTEETSDYSLLFGEKAILSFDTYNKVLHYFVEPSFLFPHGKEGDNQFEIQSYKDGVFSLRGKRSNNLMTLSPFKGNKATYLAKIRERTSLFKSVGIAPITLDQKQVALTLHPTLHQLSFTTEGSTQKVAFAYTEKGLKLYEPTTIGGYTFTEFALSEDNQELSTLDGKHKATLSYTLPYDFNSRSLWLNLTEDNCESNTIFASLYQRYKNFSYSNTAYSTSPQIRVGFNTEESGITFSFYQNATTRYTLDFLPVVGKPNQVNIVEGVRSVNWNVFASLYPLVDALIQYAPYEITNVNNNGRQYQWVSTKDSQVRFVTTPRLPRLPYNFTTKRTTITFASNYVSETILTTYKGIRRRSRTVNSARVREVLNPVIYFGKEGNAAGFHFYLTRTPTAGGNSTNVNVVLNMDYLGVACNANQLNMVEKANLRENTNWKNYTYLEPLVKVFTDNAPYTMTDYGSGTFGWTSVKNPDIWFYTQEQ